VSRAQAQSGDRVGFENRQAFQRFQEHLGRMDRLTLVRPMRAGDKLRRRAASHVCFEYFVRVVQVRNDDIELGKVIRQISGQFAVTREKTSERARLNGTCLVDDAAGQRQLDYVWITEDLEMGLRKLLTQ